MNITDGLREVNPFFAYEEAEKQQAIRARNAKRRTYDRLRKASLRLRNRRLTAWGEGTYNMMHPDWPHPGAMSFAKIFTAHQAYVKGIKDALNG